jgi:hypothetical protein
VTDDDGRLYVRACDCGVIATDYAKAHCGRDARRNLRGECPTRLMLIVAWEEVDERETPLSPAP